MKKYDDLKRENELERFIKMKDFSNIDMSWEYFSEMSFWGCNFSHSDLNNSTLIDVKLEYANFRYANLEKADLRKSSLNRANLKYANLEKADLQEANLRQANLKHANLRGTVLKRAFMQEADLSGADLTGANLYDVNLQMANLTGTIGLPPMICPSEGSFIGWKKACGKIIKLEILSDAKRSSATGRKCRCSKARVLSIEYEDGTEWNGLFLHSDYDSDFLYQKGAIVEVDNFEENRWIECAPGIHFFMTREEAINY